MGRTINFRQRAGMIILALFVPAALVFAQEQVDQKTNFFDVQITKDQVFSYKNLKFTGDYTSFESASGFVLLGKTDAGNTVVIVVGAGNATIDAPEAHQEKMKTVFGMLPLKFAFKGIYMRLSPKEYAETLGKTELAKAADDDAFNKAKEIYDLKFLGSYHAGPKAMLPPYKTRVMEFDTDAFGWIYDEEGYWLKLRKVSPYASIYPANFVNPKQK